ncbi:hypothetical protein [Nocardia sp. NPDC051750]|uniref:hypothetical protein n=1 Tax=Nocardia sp. NPDC051750 TaxID=3364325 RepID=UPI0037B676D5
MATETPTAAAADTIDEQDTCHTCGCWCYGCPCAEDEERAAENGDDEIYHRSAHCCECGRNGPECEYHCTCA